MSDVQEKQMITDVFVSGVKRGWGIATGSMLPNVLMAFILIHFLTSPASSACSAHSAAR